MFGTSLIVFAIVHTVPADPVAAVAGPHADKETRDRIRVELGLDRPIWVQYARYLGRALQGDLGRSHVTHERVSEAIGSRFPATAAVALGGLGIWLALGIPLGVVTAKWRDTPFDVGVLVLAMIGISLPAFWLARMLQFQLAYRGGITPVAGITTWQHLVLPCVTLGIIGVGYYARFVHAIMVETLGQDYIRTARAKGNSEARLLFRHGLPNILVQLLTVVGMDLAALLGGVVFTEMVFAVPGIGSLAVQAVLNLDVPMIMGTVLFSAAVVVSANVILDVLYGYLDPRVKFT